MSIYDIFFFDGVFVQEFLWLQGIYKCFVGVYVLCGIDLIIYVGEIYYLLGENGCGKSIMIKIIVGVQLFSEGEIFIQGECVVEFMLLVLLLLGIEMVYQDFLLLFNMSVVENVVLSVQLVCYQGWLVCLFDCGVFNDMVVCVLCVVNLLVMVVFFDMCVDELFIVICQLIVIVCVIVISVCMVIMDELIILFIQKEVDVLVKVINGLCVNGVVVLFVSYKFDECFVIGGQVIVFCDGEKVV